MKNNKSVQGVNALLALQLALCIMAPLALWFITTREFALSALLGALTAFIPSLVFARKLFKYQGARAAKQIVKGFYIGECLKLFLSVILFTSVFLLYKQVKPLAFFISYITMLMTHWLSPIIIGLKQNRLERN